MKPDSFDDPGSSAADASENRRAILVAVVAAIIVVLGSVALVLGQTTPNDRSTPKPTHTLQHTLAVVAPSE